MCLLLLVILPSLEYLLHSHDHVAHVAHVVQQSVRTSRKAAVRALPFSRLVGQPWIYLPRGYKTNSDQFSSRHSLESMEGSKVDKTPAGLEVVPSAQGIQALPSELSGKSAPQTVPGPEKEVAYTTDKEAIVQHDNSSKSQGLLNTASIKKRRKYWLLLAALALIIIISIAIAVPLGKRTKKRTKQDTPPYVRNLL